MTDTARWAGGRQEDNGQRSEVKRGQWEQFEGNGFDIRAMGSVAYKLGRVAAGISDATWTLVPKNEWDVAAGVALVKEAGGIAVLPDGSEPRFNREDTLYPGMVTVPEAWRDQLAELGDLVSRFGSFAPLFRASAKHDERVHGIAQHIVCPKRQRHQRAAEHLH